MHGYTWLPLELESAGADSEAVECGISDTRLDKLAATAPDGQCPIIQLSKEELHEQVQLVPSGLIGRGKQWADSAMHTAIWHPFQCGGCVS
jgi:hypothetical protein